jgi:hypothetical protein
MKEDARRQLLGAVSAYADEVAFALGSAPQPQRLRLSCDLEACELPLRVLVPTPELLPPIDAEPLPGGGRRTIPAENLDPRQRFASSEKVAERSGDKGPQSRILVLEL